MIKYLPDLVLDSIVSFLPEHRLSRYATLSAAWKRSVERRTFSWLNLSSSDDDLEGLTRIVLSKRSHLLRNLHFIVGAPPIEEDNVSDSDFFTSKVQQLFQVLADNIPNHDHAFVFELGRVSVSPGQNGEAPGRISLIKHGQQLPILTCVSHLYFSIGDSSRRVALRTAVDLAKRLPNLSTMHITTDDDQKEAYESDSARTLHREDRESSLASSPTVSCPTGSDDTSRNLVLRYHARYHTTRRAL
ncbi:hypothetical protein F4780DRAFT_624045 [Xylariomycetidae sp. FL0641]|nr:hypothetical protein F4780DRAFT_624045 [Xylariomycetidae sp. FL0641]